MSTNIHDLGAIRWRYDINTVQWHFWGLKSPQWSHPHTHATPHVTHDIFRAEPTALQISPLTLTRRIDSLALTHPFFPMHPFTLLPSCFQEGKSSRVLQTSTPNTEVNSKARFLPAILSNARGEGERKRKGREAEKNVPACVRLRSAPPNQFHTLSPPSHYDVIHSSFWSCHGNPG